MFRARVSTAAAVRLTLHQRVPIRVVVGPNRIMPLAPIILPPLFVLVATTPWWLCGVFRWWLGLVNPDWEDHAHVHGQWRRPSRLHVVSGAADASSLRPPRLKQPRHLRLVRGGDGDALDPVA